VWLETMIGATAAFCTTVSYVPQLRKVWATGETNDISFKMLLLLVAGLTLWVIYGLMRSDLVIIAANVASLTLLLCIIYFKLRERRDLAGESK
jgi:MtN3 and saliva related transmembrane protein